MRLLYPRAWARLGLLGLFVGGVMLTLLVGSPAAADPLNRGVGAAVVGHTGASELRMLAAGVTSATRDVRAARAPTSGRVGPLVPARAGSPNVVASPVVALASPDVQIAPGSSPAGGYLALELFGVPPIPIGNEEFVNFTVPSFVYNGATHTQIGVTSNGYIVVGGATAADLNCCSPVVGSTARPNGVLAPFWTDLDGTGAPGISIGTITDGSNTWIVVQWRLNVFGTTNERRFQVWIGIAGDTNPGEDITYAYDQTNLPADPNGKPFLVGAENLDGTCGASIAGLPTQDLRVTSGAAPCVFVPTCDGQTATIYVNAQGIIVGGPNSGQTYRGVLRGTAGNDVMVGTAGPDEIAGRGGNDTICAGEGDDEIEGGPGNDRLLGEGGNDELAGGGGSDTMTGGPGADKFRGGAGTDSATDFNPGEGDTKTSVP
jgi:RTX calcium-binding nonapeptide repeat (4 copies)